MTWRGRLYGARLQIGFVAVVLAAALAWGQLGWLTPAWSTDVKRLEARIASVERLNKDTRALLLNDRWGRHFTRIQQLEGREAFVPLTGVEQELLSNLRLALRLVEQQLKALNQD